MTPARLLAVLALVQLGCGDPRPLGEAECPSYEQSVKTLLDANCVSCHSQSRSEGDYRLDQYVEAVRRLPDGSLRVAPGEEDSLFVAAVRGELPAHSVLAGTDAATLEDWAVRCRADNVDSRIHPHGWSTPTDPEFHGTALRATGYELTECRTCHGEDLRGGISGEDCQSCHTRAVTSCTTCHGGQGSSAPPRDLSGSSLPTSLGVGAHKKHVTDGPLHKAYRCGSCHISPTAGAESPGHYREPVVPDGIAEVVLAPSPGGTAVWARGEATCSDSYCHAPTGAASGGTHQAPVWTAGAGEAVCGSCHGLPPPNHPGTDCESCHGLGYSISTVVAAEHADGEVDFLGGGRACTGCHGSEANPAPPKDTQGRTDPALATIGAHQAHVAADRLRGPIGCNECHLVPTSGKSPGHIDPSPAEVFPTEAGPIARADGANPTYSGGSCGTVYCHGGGQRLSADATATLNQTPSWTGGPSQAACGTCHGTPPADAIHGPDTRLDQCNYCHRSSVDEAGNIKLITDPVTGAVSSTHIDGQVQVGP